MNIFPKIQYRRGLQASQYSFGRSPTLIGWTVEIRQEGHKPARAKIEEPPRRLFKPMIATSLPVHSAPRRRWTMTAAALLLGLLVSAIALEGFCRVFLHLYGDAWGQSKDHPRHGYQLSSNPVLGYALKPGRDWPVMGALWINKYSVRDESDELAADRRRVVLVGDSVTFGIWQRQEITIASQAQRLLDHAAQPVKVLNIRVPGYGAAQIEENFRAKDAIYQFDDALYLLNLNDFTRHDSIYEGADNGLYRMYQPPPWRSLYLLRKAYYRLQKHGSVRASIESRDRWYHWLFEGNREFAQTKIQEMVRYARAHDIRFAVLILPVGSAFEPDGSYRLAGLVDQVTEMLEDVGADHIDPSERFSHQPAELIDRTEHLTKAGNGLLAEIVTDWITDRTDSGEDSHLPSPAPES